MQECLEMEEELFPSCAIDLCRAHQWKWIAMVCLYLSAVNAAVLKTIANHMYNAMSVEVRDMLWRFPHQVRNLGKVVQSWRTALQSVLPIQDTLVFIGVVSRCCASIAVAPHGNLLKGSASFFLMNLQIFYLFIFNYDYSMEMLGVKRLKKKVDIRSLQEVFEPVGIMVFIAFCLLVLLGNLSRLNMLWLPWLQELHRLGLKVRWEHNYISEWFYHKEGQRIAPF